MALLHLGTVLVAASSVLMTPSHGDLTPKPRLERSPAARYTAQQIEHYLSAQDIPYIRPGYRIILNSFTIPDDRKPVAVVTFLDDLDQPLDRLGKVTPGTCSASFIFAWYDAANRDYVSYTTRTQTSPITGVAAVQASADSNGTWTEIQLGTYQYKFRTALPAGYDQTKTHTVGIYGSRNVSAIIGKQYYSNVLYDYRPDGAAVTETWNAFATATCNACHDPLGLHGGSRREVKLCVLCHNATQSLDPDTGNSVEMRLMVHKIHNGPALANGYTIIGNQQAVHDYSHVTYPQDIRNCTTCHKADSPEGHIWFTNPTRVACGSCHDSIDWVSGDGHIAGPQANDDDCASCHQPEGEFEFDLSIKGAHTIPTKSTQLQGLKMEILNVTNTAPGQKPIVTFKLNNADGSIVAPSSLNRLRFQVGGPNSDFVTYFREDGTTATASGDAWVYNFTTNAIPEDATGSWTMAADAYRNVMLSPGPSTAVREAAMNPIYTFAVTDAQPVARRTVADTAKCNKCHETLAAHGGQRFKVEECNICHSPSLTEDGESFHMKWMVHRLHTGEELTRPYVGFEEILYPGDRRNCLACHSEVAGTTEETYQLPLPDGVLPTSTPNDFVPEWQPSAAACLSCHDSIDAAAHAYTNIAPFGEACVSCHGNNADFSVDKVHAR